MKKKELTIFFFSVARHEREQERFQPRRFGLAGEGVGSRPVHARDRSSGGGAGHSRSRRDGLDGRRAGGSHDGYPGDHSRRHDLGHGIHGDGAETNGDERRQRAPRNQNSKLQLPSDKDFYLYTISLNGQLLVSRQAFSNDKLPIFDKDNRLQRMGLILPKPNFYVSGLPATTKVTCTFIGGTCYSCDGLGNSHNINNAARVFLLGDQHCPVLAGLKQDCCPVVRVESGTFCDLQNVLLRHFKAGLRIPSGSIGVCLLLTLLMKVGYTTYWSQLLSFTEWAATYNLQILPSIPPFPSGYGLDSLISIKQLNTHLQVCHFGNSAGGKNAKFSLWQPLTSTLEQHGAADCTIPSPPICVQEVGGMYARCEGQFSNGCEGDWSFGMPRNIEETFLVSLLQFVSAAHQDLSPTVPAIVTPSKDSLIAGLRSGSRLDINSGRIVFLLGSSIMQQTKPFLQELCLNKGVQVVSCCKGGDFLGFFWNQDHTFLAAGNKDDVLFLHFLGNHMLNKHNFWMDMLHNGKRVYHLTHPTILSDQQMDKLILDTNKLAIFLAQHFKGRVFILGPFPRHISQCCGLQEHSVLDSENQRVSMTGYTNLFNQYLQASLILPERCEFLAYQNIFGKNFDKNSLVDGVHLAPSAYKACANFFLSSLQRKPRKQAETPSKMPAFSSYLTMKGLLTRNEVDTREPMEGAIDDAINLVK